MFLVSLFMQTTFVGICNLDLYSKIHRLPKVGETIHGIELEHGYGGKASNACAQFALLCDNKMKPSLLTCVGNDSDGQAFISHFKSINIDEKMVQILDNRPTGVAICFVIDGGESAIVIHPCPVTKEIINANANTIAQSKIVVTNFEIPLDAAKEALKIGKESGAKTILNASPMPDHIDLDYFQDVSVVIVNQVELNALGKVDQLFEKNVGAVVVTLGGEGAELYLPGKEKVCVAAPSVNVVDTTGAGDSFLGSFAYCIAIGKGYEEAVRIAVTTASISVQKVGAQQSYANRNHPQLSSAFQ